MRRQVPRVESSACASHRSDDRLRHLALIERGAAGATDRLQQSREFGLPEARPDRRGAQRPVFSAAMDEPTRVVAAGLVEPFPNHEAA